MLVDSHCHLDSDKFTGEVDVIVERALAAGVAGILTIGTGEGPPGIDCAIRVAERFPNVVASVGVHPHDAAKCTSHTFSDLKSLGVHPKVVGFGEIGLDYHYDFSPREQQREVFIEQLKLARELDLPVIIHTREAWDDTISVLREFGQGLPGVMHCFTGSPEQAREALDLGFHLSYGGVLTFRTADNVRESAAMTPDDRLLVETDAPYLAPIPYRGKRNEPALMVESVRKLAEVRGSTLENLAALTTANFDRLFSRPRTRKDYTGDSDAN